MPPRFKHIFVALADNDLVLSDKSYSELISTDSIILFLSKIDYATVSIQHLTNFIRNNIFIPKLEDFIFVKLNGIKTDYAILSKLIVSLPTWRQALLTNNTKYIITNTPILLEDKLTNIPARNLNSKWEDKYDGRFGHAISQHDYSNPIIFNNYVMTINHKHFQKIDENNMDLIVSIIDH